MPTISSIKLQNHLRIFAADRPQAFRYSFAVTNGLANSADDISLFDIPAGMALFATSMDVSGTLGADATIQLRAGTVTLTAASTATAAGTLMQNNDDVPSATTARTVNLLVGGANVTAGATVVVAGIIAPVLTSAAPVATVE